MLANATEIRNQEAQTCPWCGVTTVWQSPSEYRDHETACCQIEMGAVRQETRRQELDAAYGAAPAEEKRSRWRWP